MFTQLLKKSAKYKSFIIKYNPGIGDIIKQYLFNTDTPVVIDVGANQGQTILEIKKHLLDFNIYAFEPTISLFNHLKEQFSSDQRVKIFPIAFGDQKGSFNFHESAFTPTNSLLEPDLKFYHQFDRELEAVLKQSTITSVSVETLSDWYIQNMNGTIIDFLKTDTQGFDWNVIKGGIEIISKNVKILATELQYLPFYKDSVPFYKLIELLYENGFYLINLADNNKTKNGEKLIESNGIFLNSKFYPVID